MKHNRRVLSIGSAMGVAVSLGNLTGKASALHFNTFMLYVQVSCLHNTSYD